MQKARRLQPLQVADGLAHPGASAGETGADEVGDMGAAMRGGWMTCIKLSAGYAGAD
jgi:hypothetical protein